MSSLEFYSVPVWIARRKMHDYHICKNLWEVMCMDMGEAGPMDWPAFADCAYVESSANFQTVVLVGI